MIPVHKSLLGILLDKISDEEIAKTAKLFADVRIKDMTLVLRNDYSLPSFLDVLEAWMNVSSVSFAKTLAADSHRYIISHELGNKWSMFISIMIQTVLKNLEINTASFEVTDYTVMFTVPKLVQQLKQQ